MRKMLISKRKLEDINRRMDDLERSIKGHPGLILPPKKLLPNENMYEIFTQEKNFPFNPELCSVKVSFELPIRDWYELSALSHWKHLETFLAQKRNTNSRKFHIETPD